MLSATRALLVTSALLASGSDDSLLLADFPASLSRLEWRVVNDGVMGGRSEGGFEAEGEALVFAGTTNTDGGGFSSIRSDTRRFELGEYDGIRLRVRGDGRSYTFRLTTWEARRGAYEPSYWAEFGTRGGVWETVDIPFSRFRPRWRGRWLEGPTLNPAAIDGLGLMIYDGRDGPFRLEVDWIRAYRAPRPFSMEAFRWRKRPLLLFAEDEGDARLQRQVAAVEATRDRFDERDMALVVVLARGPSRAEGRRLSDGDAARLRATFGIGGDSFALRLVGKDGGVKRRADDFVPMDALYDQIDSMPMRQQEMRQ
jgi:NADH dehydrogenase [ubiquinone] 1 alpha subcomplex assembly factor 1